MKNISVRYSFSLGLACLFALTGVYAQESTVIHPTLPGSDFRDYSKPSTIIKGDSVYPTLPGSNFRDYSKPGMKIEGDMIYPT
ncbi:MAG: hypothetical protein KAH38_04300, partial [Candidatus Hydrogenedentes bacterium]|nr:hypothetical protein [Candidatus Hydrogenedentota bacterium]